MRSRLTLAFVLCLAAGTAAGTALASAEAPNQPTPQAKRSKHRVGPLPFRVVKLLPETSQALVYDQARRAHVLVSEGDIVGGFAVIEVDEEHLIVSRDGRELVLVADPRAPQPAPGAVVDPYPRDAARTGPSLIDPYAPEPVREVLAPASQRESMRGAAVVDPYAPATSGEPKVVTAPAAAAPLQPTPAPGSAAAAAVEVIRGDTLPLKRGELEAALADFTRLGKEIGFVRVGRGVKLGKVAIGSYFWKLGLRDGDVVTAIDGKPLRTLDDAAAAYARLGSARQLAVEVDRGPARGTLRFALK